MPGALHCIPTIWLQSTAPMRATIMVAAYSGLAPCAGGAYTGGGVSPARVLGPAIVFNCHWDTTWVYILGSECAVSVPDRPPFMCSSLGPVHPS